MTFTPFTGFDPIDGDDPRVTLSRGNPLRNPHQLTGNEQSKRLQADGVGVRVVQHSSGDK